MSSKSNNETKENLFVNKFALPVLTALLVGGTAPWWLDAIRSDNSNDTFYRENQNTERGELSNSTDIQGSNNTVNDNSIIAQDESIIHQNNVAGSSFSVGGDLTVNEMAKVPEFKGKIGHFEASRPFGDFIAENISNVVFLDVKSIEDLSRSPSIGFDVDYIHLWHECSIPLEPDEKPSNTKCFGTGFSIDRSDSSKDAITTWFRGQIILKGYFAVKGCSGPHQGSMGCTLRPLNPEDAR